MKEFKIYFQSQLVYVKAQQMGDQWWFQWEGRIFVVRGQELKNREQKTKALADTKQTKASFKKTSLEKKEIPILSPVPAQVVKVLVQKGKQIKPHQPLLVLSSMKMEHTLYPPAAGRVKHLRVKKGDTVKQGEVLMIFHTDLKGVK